jgi:hypothetical protein
VAEEMKEVLSGPNVRQAALKLNGTSRPDLYMLATNQAHLKSGLTGISRQVYRTSRGREVPAGVRVAIGEGPRGRGACRVLRDPVWLTAHDHR